MDGAWQLRPAELADAGEIARLSGELGYPVGAQEMAGRLAAILPHPMHRVSVVAEGGTLYGWIAVERRLTLEAGERIEIVGLVVSGAIRRGGVGRALVQDAERWARAQGFDAIQVRSNVVRTESHPFYERLGYVRRKSQHVYAKPLEAEPG
ncbi:hypothetical protein ASG87_06195 [Frateuria sp. Soil773]|uniref:GNAT family N-acetyltransferase n=1 Tax=Frateuria sp. Soil773 TaxID=1736407 RepID=UPI0006F9E4FB|nr:GNAT family N-acetyltransferase [Frateuria sp. Soil773]KRE89125.1 hypothetical protein ASG87_06195 [Frateuria sp. Soil773]